MRVRGVGTRLIVDTGATDHILTNAFASSAGVTLDEADAGTDVAGASITTTLAGTLEVSIGEERWQLEDVLAIEGPSQFASWGVGGFLSPQRLAPQSTVVVELEVDFGPGLAPSAIRRTAEVDTGISDRDLRRVRARGVLWGDRWS